MTLNTPSVNDNRQTAVKATQGTRRLAGAHANCSAPAASASSSSASNSLLGDHRGGEPGAGSPAGSWSGGPAMLACVTPASRLAALPDPAVAFQRIQRQTHFVVGLENVEGLLLRGALMGAKIGLRDQDIGRD